MKLLRIMSHHVLTQIRQYVNVTTSFCEMYVVLVIDFEPGGNCSYRL